MLGAARCLDSKMNETELAARGSHSWGHKPELDQVGGISCGLCCEGPEHKALHAPSLVFPTTGQQGAISILALQLGKLRLREGKGIPQVQLRFKHGQHQSSFH